LVTVAGQDVPLESVKVQEATSLPALLCAVISTGLENCLIVPVMFPVMEFDTWTPICESQSCAAVDSFGGVGFGAGAVTVTVGAGAVTVTVGAGAVTVAVAVTVTAGFGVAAADVLPCPVTLPMIPIAANPPMTPSVILPAFFILSPLLMT
jgi:hypothetical protein